jgi:hypothetical protein
MDQLLDSGTSAASQMLVRQEGMPVSIRRNYMFTDCPADVSQCIEYLVVQVDDVEPDCDKPQAVLFRNDNPDFLTIEYDSLSLHNKTPARIHAGYKSAIWNEGFTTR